MLSEKVINRQVIEMHKGQPHIRTEVAFLTPIGVEDLTKFQMLLLHGQMEKTIKDMIYKVQEEVGDTFECDIESVYVGVKHTL